MAWMLRLGAVVVVLLALGVASAFLANPLFFDDQYFFQPGNPEKYFADGWNLYPRWWVNQTFAITYIWLGHQVYWLRFGNLLLHFLTALVVGFFVYELLRDSLKSGVIATSSKLIGFFVALLFFVHPLAMLAQGYLIQRTILCATLFAVLALFFLWRGMSGRRGALWASIPLYACAILAKEHVVMLPLVGGLLLLLRWRTGVGAKFSAREVLFVLGLQSAVSIAVVLWSKGLIGKPYEGLVGEMLVGDILVPQELLFPLSVLNQMGLYFKYFFSWLVPGVFGVSLDMRVPFPLGFSDMSLWVGAGGFVLYVLGGGGLLWRGGSFGLLGFALLAPAFLYCTELVSVRFTEPFVVYRSYLWAPFWFLMLAVPMSFSKRSVLFLLVGVSFVVFLGMSYARLKTFSHPLFVWQEAAEVYEAQEGKDGLFGGYRIYYNLGTHLQGVAMPEMALNAFNKAIELNPTYGHSWVNRGAVNLSIQDYSAALVDYQMAAKLLPGNPIPLNGLAEALVKSGRIAEAEQVKQVACVLKGGSCGKLPQR